MLTISLKDEENKMVEQLMAALDLKRHQVIKLAIRRFLFPTEISNIPLDGAYAQVTHYGMTLVDAKGEIIDKYGTHENITVTRDVTKEEERPLAMKREEYEKRSIAIKRGD